MSKVSFNPIPRQRPNSCWRDLVTIVNLLIRGELLDGPDIERFQKRIAQYFAVKYALATNSCRAAFYLIIKALNITEGDEVILPAFNMPAFPKILKLKKIKPVFVDVDKQTLNIDVGKIEGKITDKTKAIVAVHLFGNPCQMDAIMEIAKKHRLAVIEDCANAVNARYKGRLVGTFGDACCLSLGFAKDIPTFGGGLVLTKSEALYKKMNSAYNQFAYPDKFEVIKTIAKNVIVMLATYKSTFLPLAYPFISLTKLINSDVLGDLFEEKDTMITSIKQRKYLNFQARIGISHLNSLSELQAKRAISARIYNQLLKDISGIEALTVPAEASPVYWKYPVWIENREKAIKKLIRHGIDCRGAQTYDCNTYRIFAEFKNDCPISQVASAKIITLPIYPKLKAKESEFIGRTLQRYYSSGYENRYLSR